MSRILWVVLFIIAFVSLILSWLADVNLFYYSAIISFQPLLLFMRLLVGFGLIISVEITAYDALMMKQSDADVKRCFINVCVAVILAIRWLIGYSSCAHSVWFGLPNIVKFPLYFLMLVSELLAAAIMLMSILW